MSRQRISSLILYYLFSGTLVLMGVSLVGRLGVAPFLLAVLAVISSIMIVLTSKGGFRSVLAEWPQWLLWLGVIAGTYTAAAIASSRFGSSGHIAFLALLILYPIVIRSVKRNNNLKKLLSSYINLILILSILSLVLWLAGPIAGFLESNCTIPNTWHLEDGIPIGRVPGYYHLLYETQWQVIGPVSFIRNTGIFGEGPAYAFVLLVALLFELFMTERPRRWVVCLLLITMLTTFSTGGMLLAVSASGLFLLHKYYRRIVLASRAKRAVITLLICGVVLLAGCAVISKMQTSSGNIHFDDYQAGIKTWMTSPVFGMGLSNDESIIQNMSTFRMPNTGFSSAILYVMATGGLVYLFVWAASFAGYFISREPKRIAMGLVLIATYVIMAGPTLFLTAFLLSLGSEQLLSAIFDNRGIGHV